MNIGKSKQPQLPAMPAKTEEQLHDEAIIRAMSGTQKLREDLGAWRSKAESMLSELAFLKNTNDLLRRDKDRLEREVLRLTEQNTEAEVKLVDMESFINTVCQMVRDQADNAANSVVSACANAVTMSKAFFDELHSRRKKGRAFIPPPITEDKLTPAEEAAVKAVGQTFGADAKGNTDNAVN